MRRVVIMLLCLGAATGGRCGSGADGGEGTDRFVWDAELSEATCARLSEAGWVRSVGAALGLWVSVERQELVGIRNGGVEFRYPCSTAARGVGNREGSYQTPTGWHAVTERIGDGLPRGAVFKERRYTGRIWDGGATTDDLILSRILWLSGLESGVNAGPGIDSHDRYIYIHGTPEEDKLGRPASMGCVRLSNEAVIELFDRTAVDMRVLITEW